MKLTAALLLAAMSLAASAVAQEAAAPKCPEDAKPLPADLAAWTTRKPLAAVGDPAKLGEAVLKPGAAVDAAMLPTPEVNYPARPANPGGKVSRGGLLRLTIDHAATYHVAISTHSWIDVVVDGKAAESIAHGPGPACSGIRKVVDYALPTGELVLQLSAGDKETTAILVAEKH